MMSDRSSIRAPEGTQATAHRIRRTRDYTLVTHVVERLMERAGGGGWMAELAHRAGLQPPVVVDAVALRLPAPSADLAPLRIAFASDFHTGPTTHPTAIASACDALARLRPDLLLGGDFVSLNNRHIEPLATLLGRIPTPLGRFAVLGNHDLWADDHPTTRRLNAAGVQVLVNTNRRLPPPYDHVWPCGLGDPSAGAPDVAATLAGADGVRIALMRSPEGLEFIAGERFGWCCAATPTAGRSLARWPAHLGATWGWNKRYPVGRHRLDRSRATLLVSRGVGYGGLPLRLFAPAEVILVTITWERP